MIGKHQCGNPIDVSGLLPLYNELLRQFCIGVKGETVPQLIPYCSFDKTIEVKYIDNLFTNESGIYLLFDTHLLDIFGEFTEAFLSAKSNTNIIRRLVNLLFAERYYNQTRFNEALYFVYNHHAIEYRVSNSKERQEKLAVFLLVQEAFTLCHELSHWCLFRRDTVEKQRQLDSKRPLWEKYLSDLIDKRKEKADAHGVVMLSKMKEHLQLNDQIVEECACDTFAAIFLIEYFKDSGNMSPTDITVGAFLGIQNMQLLSFLNQSADANTTNAKLAEQQTLEITLRLIVFKNHIFQYLCNYLPEVANECNSAILAAKERYDKLVYSDFLKVLNESLVAIGKLDHLPQIQFLDDEWDAINQFLYSRLVIQS